MGDPRKLAGYAVVAGAGLVAVGLVAVGLESSGQWVFFGPFLALTAFLGWRAITHDRVGGLIACALLWTPMGIGVLGELTAAGHGVAFKAAASGVLAGTVAIGAGTIVLARGVRRAGISSMPRFGRIIARVLLAFLAWMVAAMIAYGVPVWLGWCSRQIEPGPFCLDSPPWWLFVQVGLMIGAPWLMWKKTRWLSAASKSSPTDEPSTNA